MKRLKHIAFLIIICFVALVPTSCVNEFTALEESPNWLGPNIYDYLKAEKNYTNYIHLIDDCGYSETMQRSGSVTIFVADDAAFERFYATNTIGVRKYEDMSQSLKYMIIRAGLLTDSYLIERMSTNETGSKGQILRRTTALSLLDSIPVVNGDTMPSSTYWNKFRGRNFKLMQDASDWTMVHFLEKNMTNKGITNNDFQFITGKSRVTDDAFIYNTKVLKKNIACKNGYVNVLENVMLPPMNMAGYVRTSKNISQFNNLMNRFCAPYFYAKTAEGDTIFQLRYFNSGENKLTQEPDAKGEALGNVVSATLLFDPGWNKIQTSTGSGLFATDMPAMFVPSNAAMSEYFSATGLGSDLFDEFKTWDKVPNNIAADFVSNHMKKSFLTALPSQFGDMKDESGYLMNVTTSNIEDSYISRNGLVYTINKVLPPLDYRTVIGPVKVNSITSIFQKAQGDSYVKFIYYFRSLLNTYSYFATLDASMNDYRDPVSQGYTSTKKETWRFKIADNGTIQAVAKRAGGDSVTYADARVTNRLQDIFDLQTIVGEITDGQEYYITKGGGAVRVKGNVEVAPNGQKMFSVGTTLEGGGNIERGNKATVVKNYSKENGCTYFIDGIIENPVTSVFGNLQKNPQFSKFFELLGQSDIFTSLVTGSTRALNNKVKFFDLFHYTIYVPTNEAINQAIADGLLPSQDEIDNAATDVIKATLVEKRLRFLKYHFQDNSIFVGGEPVSNKTYLSSTLNKVTGKFYPLYVTNTNGGLQVRSYHGETAHVLKTEGCYNVMARDVVVNSADLTAATSISTSSWAVIHLIDKVLRFE